jgi:hypothetical protein
MFNCFLDGMPRSNLTGNLGGRATSLATLDDSTCQAIYRWFLSAAVPGRLLSVENLPDSKNCSRTRSLIQNGLAYLRIFIVLAAAGTTVLFLIPLRPGFPAPGLDASWAYAMNEAVARHLVFGQDILLTFGPLASVYTGMYHPATDWIMLFGRALPTSTPNSKPGKCISRAMHSPFIVKKKPSLEGLIGESGENHRTESTVGTEVGELLFAERTTTSPR